jgi:hypothetical protein
VHCEAAAPPMSHLGQTRPYGHVGSNVRFARKQSSSGHR